MLSVFLMITGIMAIPFIEAIYEILTEKMEY